MRAKTNLNKTVFFKRLFIKICRIFGYELIDQGNFHIPTQDKLLNENISIQGKKSINLPLGEVQISRKVKALTIIFRSCTNVNMLTQNKKRLFDCDKSEYTFRSLHSIISSLKKAKNLFPKINFNIIVVDHNSGEKNQDKIKNQLIKSTIKHSLITLDLNEFKDTYNKVLGEKGAAFMPFSELKDGDYNTATNTYTISLGNQPLEDIRSITIDSVSVTSASDSEYVLVHSDRLHNLQEHQSNARNGELCTISYTL